MPTSSLHARGNYQFAVSMTFDTDGRLGPPGQTSTHLARAGRRSGGTAPAVVLPAPPASGGSSRRFRVTFVGEQVVEAESIRDAISRAEALGATEITRIVREA